MLTTDVNVINDYVVLMLNYWRYTVFILINAPGVLQVIDILEIKCGQIHQYLVALNPFWVSFGHFFP